MDQATMDTLMLSQTPLTRKEMVPPFRTFRFIDDFHSQPSVKCTQLMPIHTSQPMYTVVY